MISAFLFSFLLITALLWVIIHTEGNWLLKFIFITLSIYLSVSVLFSMENFKGWPTNNDLPENFQVHWALIEEPSKIDEGAGAIYLWLAPIEFESNCAKLLMCLDEIDKKQPRAYKVEYSKESHEMVLSMLERIKAGEIIIGKNISDEEIIEPRESSDFFLDEIKIYELPPISGLPKK